MGDIALIKEILKKTDKNINIMVYEPCINIFLTLLEQVDISEYFNDRAVGLIVKGINENEIEPVIEAFINISNLEFVKSYINTNYKELFKKDVLDFLKKWIELQRVFWLKGILKYVSLQWKQTIYFII